MPPQAHLLDAAHVLLSRGTGEEVWTMSMQLLTKDVLRGAVALGAACATAMAVGQVGCSGSGNQPGVGNNGGHPSPGNDGATGSIGLSLVLAGGAVVNSVTYTLYDSTNTVIPLPNAPDPGTIDVSNSNSIDFQLGGVPAGSGDSISLSATVVGGGTCQGTASGITVAAHATAGVTVQLLCSLPGADSGNVAVTGVPTYCGTWNSLASGSNGTEVYVGESIVLTATALGPDPSHLGYTWTMSSPIGAFGATTAGVGAQGQDENVGTSDPMQFLCTAPGTTTITVAVDDGPVPAGAGACPASLSTTSTTVVCDAYPANKVETAWVELAGPNGGSNGFTGNVAIARAVTGYVPPSDAGTTNPCPNITINGGAPVQMNLRAPATTSLAARPVNTPPNPMNGPLNKPALFPVSSCEWVLPANATSAVVAGWSLPIPKTNPTKIVVIGDTGCRLQNGNGTQSCNDPNPAGTDTPYPFAAIAAAAAAQNPDLVLHVGDLDYRDNECPPGLGFNCGGSPWGFGWDTWEADVFAPGAPLLAAAPWIMVRGNHEQCNRAGQGWFRFFDTSPFAGDAPGAKNCNYAADDMTATGGSYENPILIQINAATQLLAFDTSNGKPLSDPAGTAGANADGTTPTGTTSAWYTSYQSELTTSGSLIGAAPVAFNFWASHHPIFAYSTAVPPALPTNSIPLFPPVMASVFPGTYFPPAVNLAMHGHTHDFQAVNFAPGALPGGGTFQPVATLVSGNAGDILDTALPYPLTGTSVSAVKNPSAVSVATVGGVQQFATDDHVGPPFENTNSNTDNTYGYMVLQYNAGPSPTWVATEYRWDNTVRDVCTLATTGAMSCASWGVIPPNDAGVY